MGEKYSRAELDAALKALAGRIPQLIAENRDGDVLEAFAGEAEAIEERTDDTDMQYTNGQIDCMLASAGLIRGQ